MENNYNCSPLSEQEKHNVLFKEITDKMLEIYSNKNADYGNAAEKSLDEPELGLSSIVGIVYHKILRIVALHKHFEISKINESLEDTFLDIANYCIITVMWLKKHKA